MEAVQLQDRVEQWRFVAEMVGIAAIVASFVTGEPLAKPEIESVSDDGTGRWAEAR